MAWIGATVNRIEPDPGNDGIWFMGYKAYRVSPIENFYHYVYVLYNQNLDRSIQSFSVPLGPGIQVSQIGFHAPPQHPGFAHDGTAGRCGYSSSPWTVTQDANSITWSTETFAQNQNANAIRFGTMYTFDFYSDQGRRTPPRYGRLLQDRFAYDGCDPGTNGNWHADFLHADSQPDVRHQRGATATVTSTPRQLQRLQPPGPTSTPTPTATSTPTPTPTATPTPTGTRQLQRQQQRHQRQQDSDCDSNSYCYAYSYSYCYATATATEATATATATPTPKLPPTPTETNPAPRGTASPRPRPTPPPRPYKDG